jgi:hydroxymethylpyrimidine pyrophosphatase-like HAD family hydrolase
MRYVALAAGFDGTLAKDGRSDARCVDVLRQLSSTGRKLILVTARELRELLEIFPEARIFDYVIAENGAVMHRPAERFSSIMAEAPSETLLRELRLRNVVPLSAGSSIIKTSRDNEAVVVEVLKRLRLDHQVFANGDTLIVLPAEVDKASGVAAALRELGLSPHNLVVIGDAQNDLALFGSAEYSVAVRNADSSLKAAASRVLDREFCDGFLEVACALLKDDLRDAAPRHHLLVGYDADGNEVKLHPFQDSLLLLGAPGSGKRAVCRMLLEQLDALDYQCCVVAAETELNFASSRGLVTWGSPHDVPRLSDVMRAIEQPDVSVFVNIAGLGVDARVAFTEALLLQLQALHDRTGRPHAIFILDAAAQFLLGSVSRASGPLAETALICAASSSEALSDEVLSGFKQVVHVGEGHADMAPGLAHAVTMTFKDVPGIPATLLSRAPQAASQATMGGRVPVAPCASFEVTESEASGY